MTNNKLAAVSLFSGAGGFDWGFHRAGFQILLACEKLENASETLAHNLHLEVVKPPITTALDEKPVVVEGDIREVDFSEVRIQPDVLIGGPPCQDFSQAQAHLRMGLNGGRGQLYLEFVRAVMFLQPKIFVFENVPGLVNWNQGLAYKTILGDLENLEETRNKALSLGSQVLLPQGYIHGYRIAFKGVVDVTKLGVPQTRKRLIVIGIRFDLYDRLTPGEFEEIVNYLESQMKGADSLLSKYPLTCIEVFEGRPLVDLRDKYRSVMEAYRDIWCDPELPKAQGWKSRVWDKLRLEVVHDYFVANQLDFENYDANEFEKAMEEHEGLLDRLGWLGKPISDRQFEDDSNRLPRQTQRVMERLKRIPPDENAEFLYETPWKVVSRDISFIYRRAAPLKPAWTVMAYGGGGTYGYHYDRNRGQLTLRERARIQTFTDDYVFKGKNVRAQIGEAVPPLLGEKIAHMVREVLNRVK